MTNMITEVGINVEVYWNMVVGLNKSSLNESGQYNHDENGHFPVKITQFGTYG